MKHLLICRHSKTESSDLPKPDHERELTERGRNDAASLAAGMQSKNLIPKIILSSDSVRTRQTTEIICMQMGLDPGVLLLPELYGAEPADVVASIQTYGGSADCLMVVGHNPTLEDVASDLARASLRLKTSWTAHFTSDLSSWSDFTGANSVSFADVLKPSES